MIAETSLSARLMRLLLRFHQHRTGTDRMTTGELVQYQDDLRDTIEAVEALEQAMSRRLAPACRVPANDNRPSGRNAGGTGI